MFFSHNLPTTNVKSPIKGSKTADFRLIFFKRKNKEITSWNFFSSPDDIIPKPLDSYALITFSPKKLKH